MIDFTTRTRDDFYNFDKRRNEVMQPTQEEIMVQEEQQKEYLLNMTKEKLSIYGIILTWKEKDFGNLWKSYIEWDVKEKWKGKNTPMNEWLWDDNRLKEIVKLKSKDNNNLKDFCNFVLQYES